MWCDIRFSKTTTFAHDFSSSIGLAIETVGENGVDGWMYIGLIYGFDSNELNNSVVRITGTGIHVMAGRKTLIKSSDNREAKALVNLMFIFGL